MTMTFSPVTTKTTTAAAAYQTQNQTRLKFDTDSEDEYEEEQEENHDISSSSSSSSSNISGFESDDACSHISENYSIISSSSSSSCCESEMNYETNSITRGGLLNAFLKRIFIFKRSSSGFFPRLSCCSCLRRKHNNNYQQQQQINDGFNFSSNFDSSIPTGIGADDDYTNDDYPASDFINRVIFREGLHSGADSDTEGSGAAEDGGGYRLSGSPEGSPELPNDNALPSTNHIAAEPSPLGEQTQKQTQTSVTYPDAVAASSSVLLGQVDNSDLIRFEGGHTQADETQAGSGSGSGGGGFCWCCGGGETARVEQNRTSAAEADFSAYMNDEEYMEEMSSDDDDDDEDEEVGNHVGNEGPAGLFFPLEDDLPPVSEGFEGPSSSNSSKRFILD